MLVLEVKKLTKDYGNHKGAFDINFSLEPGEIVGFIGPNGAGKSTTLNMIGGFIKPTAGQISIFGNQVDWLSIHKIYPRIGFLLSEIAFEKNLKPAQIFTQTQRMLNRNLESTWTEMAEFLELDLDRSFNNLSYGNRKKVAIVNCLMHNPELILLDEPTGGLDPLVQQKFFEILKKRTKNGASVLLSSHVLGEVQSACDRVLMIKDGGIILSDTTKSILEKAARVFKFFNIGDEIIEDIKKAELSTKIEMFGEETLVYTEKYEEVLRLLFKHNKFDFYLEKPSLEEMFLEFYK